MPISKRSDPVIDLVLDDVEVSFPGLPVPVLAIPHLAIAAGETVAVTGPSGSGKSTLVNIITGLERPRRGRVLWAGADIARLGEGARDRWRAAHVGLVMQDFHLFPGISALDNVLLPARLALRAGAEVEARGRALLARVGLKRPDQDVGSMSRGEMQRVAVARALLMKPGVIVADEPTASLDPESGAGVAALLVELAAEEKATLVAISHDDRLVACMRRVVRLRDGTIRDDRPTGPAEAVSP